MKNTPCILVVLALFVTSCATKKKLETSAPFDMGQAYAQKWELDNRPETKGYDIVIPIISLDKKKATLHNVYYQGRMANLKIDMWDTGAVAIATFPQDKIVTTDVKPVDQGGKRRKRSGRNNDSSFPFDLGATEAVISYLHNEKVKYIKIYGIQQHSEIISRSQAVKIGQ